MPATAPNLQQISAVLPQKTLFSSLTGIRLLLAVWVISYHLCFSTGVFEFSALHVPSLLSNVLRTAYVAVETFFILSGFILCYTYPSEIWWTRAQLRTFAAARFARIYPVYAVSLVLAAPFAFAPFLRDPSTHEFLKQSGIAVLHWGLVQSWFPSILLEWNPPAWSLSTEIFFYCCFPFMSVWIWRQRRTGLLVLLGLGFWLMAIAVPLALAAHPNPPYDTAVSPEAPSGNFSSLIKFNPILRIPDFLLGLLAGRVYGLLREKHPYLRGRGYWFCFAGIALYLAAAAFGDEIPFFLFNNGFVAPALVLIVFGLALGGGPIDYALSRPWVVRGGELSYCIYLLQDPVLSWFRFGLKKAHLHFPILLLVVYPAILVLLSIFVVEGVEKPMNRLLRKRLIRPALNPVVSSSPHISIAAVS
jgi:peptidoglycan/LPS O-acetylase OafA/YrhL